MLKKTVRLAAKTVPAVLLLLLLFLLFTELTGIEFYQITGSSMEPSFHPGDIAVVDRRNTDPEPGEAIAFLPDEEGPLVVVHRVIGKRRQGACILYRTRGDANETADFAEISQSAVKGTVIGRIPGLLTPGLTTSGNS